MATKDRKDPLSASRRHALTAAPFVLAAAALYNWVIAPHVGYLHAMQRLEPVMDRMADELDAVSGSLDERLSTMRTLRGELAKVQEGLFGPEESEAFLRGLQALVETTGCAMTEADFTQEKEAKRTEDPNVPVCLKASHADLTVAGSFDQIVSLLRMLQQQRQKVWVDSCRLDLVEPRKGRLQCQLGLTIYAHLQPGELPQ
jgi:hypothetical protein